MSDLLPINATDLEKKLSETCDIHALPVPLSKVWQADTCPGNTLPQLAWALSVDFWDNNWAEEDKRQTIADSFNVHAKKGTPDSIRRVMRNAGFEEITIIEGLHNKKRDGSISRNGVFVHGDPNTWAMYVINLKRPISNNQAQHVKKILAVTAPARCHLAALDYREVAFLHNGEISTRNGHYNRGAV